MIGSLTPTRELVCADAVPWLRAHRSVGAIVTSLPDAEEMGISLTAWQTWFLAAARAAMESTTETAPTVFYQTDRKADGRTWSKPALLFVAAEHSGSRLLWHKIALRRAVGSVDLHRPGYTHLLAFSRKGRPGAATPDVLPKGKSLYANGMGITAALVAVRFAAQSASIIVDPFCGRGTVLAVAHALGLSSLGIDIDPEQIARARCLRLKRA